jgi:2-iminobutanoate/2-iminopropanoate deaminase
MSKLQEKKMKKAIYSDNAPKAVGPYSQAILTGNLVFTSGQIAIDPGSGKLIEGGTQEQTRQVMANLSAVLKAAGTDLTKAIKATVFLHDINNFSKFNEVYGEYFPSNPPARSAFQVAALPLGAMVEIEMIATVAM